MRIPNDDKGKRILLIEDNEADIRLTKEAFKGSTFLFEIHVVKDGVEAIKFLHRKGVYESVPSPDIILLDLNIPKKSGFEVLSEIKEDENLKHIPVIILTTSDSPEDIMRGYNAHANSFISKPVNFTDFFQVVNALQTYWLSIAQLPKK